ncbi:MAG: hypothetical protein LUI02_06670 [Clostridiales bacterium]|nr:hypothetical protein [Clostridiales bacterium]
MALKKTNQELITKIFKQTEKVYAKIADLDEIKANEGDVNVIEKITVNGTAVEVTDKTAAITVPTAVSGLENDAGYQTASDVETIAAGLVAASGHASVTTADEIPDAADAESNILYLVEDADGGYYDIYALIDGEMKHLGTTTVDLSNYSTTEEMNAAIAEAINGVDLSAYSTTEEMNTAIQSAVDNSGHLTEDDFEDFTDEEIEAAYEAAVADEDDD